MDLRMAPVGDDGMLERWRHVHNVVVPPAAMSLADARGRRARNRLAIACLGSELVGCSTVRPPAGAERVATVIARVLPEFRGRGFGTAVYAEALEHARALGAAAVETCVLAANTDGLRFARLRGFDEIDRYTLDGDPAVWVDLRLRAAEAGN
ncbi:MULTISPECIES: GNAT family N-acetyltransferase [unclassified Streptomyces]|uniref:GNAT family N-acetyltransferase n=1 Tax=unclassified Streptomyces TaxID=2593676 RepID=UPI00214C124D|nr:MULTISPECIES: GNAT family N-acetyltransferase [unclassified Streptomyces]